MDTVLRVAIMYVLILVGLRFVGKREFSELTPMDLIVLLLIPELVSQSLLGDDYSLTNAIIGVVTLLAVVLVVSVATYISPRAERVLEGTPSVLVDHGRIVEKNLEKERITPDELFAQIHLAGLERLDQVRWAIMENDGKIAVIEQRGERHQPPERNISL